MLDGLSGRQGEKDFRPIHSKFPSSIFSTAQIERSTLNVRWGTQYRAPFRRTRAELPHRGTGGNGSVDVLGSVHWPARGGTDVGCAHEPHSD